MWILVVKTHGAFSKENSVADLSRRGTGSAGTNKKRLNKFLNDKSQKSSPTLDVATRSASTRREGRFVPSAALKTNSVGI
jgi:hypothetical protein